MRLMKKELKACENGSWIWIKGIKLNNKKQVVNNNPDKDHVSYIKQL